MVPAVDDGPSDPIKFRRTLLPLEIEDADEPPTIGRRLTNLFRKKNRVPDPVEEESPAAAPKPTASSPTPKRVSEIDVSGADDRLL
jgi:hypothetical protein